MINGMLLHQGIGLTDFNALPTRRASSIDIYNNDFHMLNDDFIETDGGLMPAVLHPTRNDRQASVTYPRRH